MTTINNFATLAAEIKRLQFVVKDKEEQLRNDAEAIYQSMLPGVVITSAIKKIGTDLREQRWNSITWKTVQGGLLLWTGHLLYKAKKKVENNIMRLVDRPFTKMQSIFRHKYET